ncbi:MAG: MmgE/PrpD family protein [Chloroflexi bacterium]|nr:MmgE/PrpD family protein [Chloroflexota bacterium]
MSEALQALGRFTADLDAPPHGSELDELLHRTLLDTLGVVVAAAQTSEMQALVGAWAPSHGAARLLGFGRTASVEPAAYLNGVASVTLEMDEGNKYVRGHPASHVLPAALAVAQEQRASGPEFAAAFLAGHEVASRFGRATRLHPNVHPHGNFGIAGAAAACAKLLGLDADGIACAINSACGLVTASAWSAAIRGDLVRNAWLGSVAISGIAAARLAAAGLARLSDLPESTLGEILGTFDASELTRELGQRLDVGNAYFKRHSSCSYTHPTADALLDLRTAHPELDCREIERIDVDTYPIAATLSGTEVPTRLAAMFSIPYVAAVTLASGEVGPAAFDARHREDPEIQRLVYATRVRASDEFAARLPDERGARVTLTLADGRCLSSEVPNPVGDAAYHPFGLPEVRAKLSALLPPGCDPEEFEAHVRQLVRTSDVNEVLREMP